MSIPPAPPGLSEHYSSPVFQRQPRHYAAYNPQKSHAACFAGKIVMFEVGSRKTLSAWCEQGKKMQEYLERNTLLACRPASARLEITGLRSPRGVGCRGEGRALASAVQHTRPSMQKMVTAGCPGGPGGDPSCVHDPGGICLQRPRTAVDYCDVTQTRMGVQGRFLDASSLTRQSKYNLFRGAALRHLVSVRAVKRYT